MLKVLIADDEPKIRQGLREAITWESLGMEVTALARDGEEALALARRDKPDLCLIDICMPLLDGLTLIERLQEINPGMLSVIVTGHDEFDYAQKAVKLQVFDYILKPVCEEELLRIVTTAKHRLEGVRERERRYRRAEARLKKNMPLLRRKFLADWIAGHMTALETQEELEFHRLALGSRLGLIVLDPGKTLLLDLKTCARDRQVLLFALESVCEETLAKLGPFIAGRDDRDNLVAVAGVDDLDVWQGIGRALAVAVAAQLGWEVEVHQALLAGGPGEVPAAYAALCDELYLEKPCHPLVRKAKAHLESGFRHPDLSLQEIADALQVSLSYLSRLFKREIGVSFSDYLIRYRIKESIKLLSDPKFKIYEVAEAVGYSSQHYFSAAFKKVLGLAPSEYRQKT